ncbi:MAG: hypothetical protein ACRBDI_03960 [Alphaproteobacteria bacterium]
MTYKQDITMEKTLFDVLRDVWRAKLYMLVCVIISLICAFVFMGAAQKYYRAQMIVAPAVPMGQGLSLAADIGEGSAQVQGSALQSSAAFLQFEHIYSGVSVASILLNDKAVMARIDMDRVFEFSSPEKEWTPEALSEYLRHHVVLASVSGTPLRSLVYYHPDKEFARDFVGRVHRIADEIIRARVLREASERIEYLDKALGRSQNPDHRRNLTALLMEQERIKMLVSLDQPYAARVVEFPYVSAISRWPDPYFIYPVFFFMGLFLGFVIYGVRHHGRG